MTDEPMTVAELEALLEGTTPGPWTPDEVWCKHHEGIPDRWEWCIDAPDGFLAYLPVDEPGTAKADAALIAAAPRIAAALIAALGERDEARKEITLMGAELDEAIEMVREIRPCDDDAPKHP